MNELMIKKNELEFLPKTNLNSVQDLAHFISDIYLSCMEYLDDEEYYPKDIFYVPTRFMVAYEGWNAYEELYWDFCQNGHDPFMLKEIQHCLESGKTEDDIIDDWRDWRSYNSSYYNPVEYQDTEGACLRDILKLLDIFQFSYLLDENDNVANHPEKIEIRDWINPPTKQVW